MTTQEQNKVETMLAISLPSDDYVGRFMTNFERLMLRHPAKLDQDITRLPRTSRAFWTTNSAEMRKAETGGDDEVTHIMLAGYLARLYTQTGVHVPDPLK